MKDFKFLEPAEAIERIGGDEDVYIELLKTFAESYGKNADAELEAVLASEAAKVLQDSELRLRAVKAYHKIKGASLTVGANLLGNSAKTLELTLKDETFTFSTESVEKYESFKKDFLEKYKATLQEIIDSF